MFVFIYFSYFYIKLLSKLCSRNFINEYNIVPDSVQFQFIGTRSRRRQGVELPSTLLSSDRMSHYSGHYRIRPKGFFPWVRPDPFSPFWKSSDILDSVHVRLLVNLRLVSSTYTSVTSVSSLRSYHVQVSVFPSVVPTIRCTCLYRLHISCSVVHYSSCFTNKFFGLLLRNVIIVRFKEWFFQKTLWSYKVSPNK